MITGKSVSDHQCRRHRAVAGEPRIDARPATLPRAAWSTASASTWGARERPHRQHRARQRHRRQGTWTWRRTVRGPTSNQWIRTTCRTSVPGGSASPQRRTAQSADPTPGQEGRRRRTRASCGTMTSASSPHTGEKPPVASSTSPIVAGPNAAIGVADEERHRGEPGAVPRGHGIPHEQHEAERERRTLARTEQQGPHPRRHLRSEPHPELARATEHAGEHEQHPRVGHLVEQRRCDQPGDQLGAGEHRHEQAGVAGGPAVRLVGRREPGERGVELPRLAGEEDGESHAVTLAQGRACDTSRGGVVGQRVPVHRPRHRHPGDEGQRGERRPHEQRTGHPPSASASGTDAAEATAARPIIDAMVRPVPSPATAAGRPS